MSAKTSKKVEFGDFQTPDDLARRVCELLRHSGISPGAVIEPTCGTGVFLRAAIDSFPECGQFVGFEINREYAEVANQSLRAEVHCENFFEKDWTRELDGRHEPVLVLGNPPWVTNSTIGAINGTNLPVKSNFQRLDGFDAITGKSNFDISEWMLTRMLECLSGRNAVMAMLCKTSVARKVLRCAWTADLQIARSSIYAIDAEKHFGASVDACLLVCCLHPGSSAKECVVHTDLDASRTASTFGLHRGRLVADLDAIKRYGWLYGKSPTRWRSGIKHDCSRVMELRPRGGDDFENGLGEVVSLERTFLYPMLKSSELMKEKPTPTRYMLVTQRAVGDDTSRIERQAPRTWDYLQSHAEALDGRASSIYRNRPRFSVFGVGGYSFAQWKVAISGFYKRLDFRCVGPVNEKPVVLDDTCYFLPCRTESDALVLAALLNSNAAQGLLRSFLFWDEKRPVTIQVLADLNLGRLAAEEDVPLPTWADAPEQMSLFDGV